MSVHSCYDDVKSIMSNEFDIKLGEFPEKLKKSFSYSVNSSHKKTKILISDNSARLNMDFLSLKENTISSKYYLNEKLIKCINHVNESLDVLDALRFSTYPDGSEYHSCSKNLNVCIDFEIHPENISDNSLNFFTIHLIYKTSNIILKTSDIQLASGYSVLLGVMFDFNGNVINNVLERYKNKVMDIYGGKDFVKYGELTDMMHI